MNFLKTILFALIVAMVPVVGNAYIGPDGQSNSTDQSGSFKTRELADIKIINVTGSTASLGSIMCASTVEDDGYRASECSQEAGPALCVLAESCTDGSRCSCRQHGYISQVNVVDTADDGKDATAGSCLYVSGTDNGGAQGFAGDIPSSGTIPYPVCLGVFLDSDTDGGSVEAYINIR